MLHRWKDWARRLKRDLVALSLAARDPRTLWLAKALALAVIAYALSPIDLIPDFIPVLGYLDDLILVPLGLLAVARLIPPQVLEALNRGRVPTVNLNEFLALLPHLSTAPRFSVGPEVYPIIGNASDAGACHCSQCRRTSGHFAASTAVSPDRLRLVEERGLRWYRSSPEARRGFCGECGASLFWEPNARDYVAIAAGTLDPYMNTSNSVSLFSAFRAGTAMSLMAIIGSTAGNRMLLTVPLAKVVAERCGLPTADDFPCLASALLDDAGIAEQALAPEMIDQPIPRVVTKNMKPNNPKMMDGMAARQSVPNRITLVTLLSLVYSVK